MQVLQGIAGLLIGSGLGLGAAWAVAQGLAVPPPSACPEHPVLEARIADLESRIGP